MENRGFFPLGFFDSSHMQVHALAAWFISAQGSRKTTFIFSYLQEEDEVKDASKDRTAQVLCSYMAFAHYMQA